MIYTITYYSASRAVGSDSCTGSVDRAKELAINAVDGGVAQRAEVRDLNKTLLYHFARTPCC
jgi:hypothetical protein